MTVGDLVRITGTFSVAGVATDPTTVTLKVRTPSGAVSTYTYAGGGVTKDATGVYRRDVSATEPGRWLYRWEGTGTAEAAEEGSFDVEMSAFV
jgi:hypothetical protein